MMRNFSLTCAIVLTLASRASSTPEQDFVRSHAQSFPLVTMERSNLPFAKVHTLEGPDKSLEFRGRYYSAFRFTVPEWLDGDMVWMFTKEGPDTELSLANQWSIFPEDARLPSVLLYEVDYRWRGDDRFPPFCRLFPGCPIFTVQPIHMLERGKRYIVHFSYPKKERTEVRFALTVSTERGLKEFGMLPTGNPHMGPNVAFQTTPDVTPKDPTKTASEASTLFMSGKKDQALALLEKDCNAYIAAGTRFQTFYTAIWKEGQVGASSKEREWRAAAYDWLQRKCQELRAFALVEELAGNHSDAMIGIHAYGAARQALAPFHKSMKTRELPLAPQIYPDQGPAITSLPEIRKRTVPFGSAKPLVEIDFDGSIQLDYDPPRRFETTMNALATLDALAGQTATALERYEWACKWSIGHHDNISGQRKHFQIEEGWYAARAGMAQTLARLGLHEAAITENAAIIARNWPDVYQDRSHTIARQRQIDSEISLGNAKEPMLAELDDLRGQLGKNRFVSHETCEAADITKAKCLTALGKAADAEALLTELADDGNATARLERIRMRIAAARFDKLESELLTVLANYRESGLKIDEAGVYSLYADLLEKTGRSQEAIAMRGEAVRLQRSFDLFVALPQELAKLSLSLASANDAAGAKAAADEASALSAKTERIPTRIAESVKAILATTPATPSAKGAASAAIDAKKSRPNAFYSIPVDYRHQHPAPTQHITKESPYAGLRVTSSAPARVEMYDAADRPVSVDTNGNGDLTDIGDSILQDADGDGQPDLLLTNRESALRLNVFPTGKIPDKGITLKIEALVEGTWTAVSEKKITP